MDRKFFPAMFAIRRGNLYLLQATLAVVPRLATARSSCSHPTLMQCLALDGVNHPAELQLKMASALLKRGSVVNEPLIACASIGNLVLAEFLLDNDGAVNGDPAVLNGWTPLEESLYWGFPELSKLLLSRGAACSNLRTAAGLGRDQEVLGFFDESGELRSGIGGINSPFGGFEGGTDESAQHVLDNALAYAAMGGHVSTTVLLLDKGASALSHPVGFHYRGTALHWAALRGHGTVCECLLDRGADPTARDMTIDGTPADWAAHEAHSSLAEFLESVGGQQRS